MTDQTFKVGIAGVGKIARDQHIPSIRENDRFELAATASRNANVEGADAYDDLQTLLEARPDVSCISLCTPPHVRYGDARRALLAGRHVMLEKPPGATLSEVNELMTLALTQGVSLFATWHSRHAACVQMAKDWLRDKTIQKVNVVWKEDVRRWHPGQEWIWEAGGLGVFDPGINGLSVLTEIYPCAMHLSKATLAFPANRDTPIAADLAFVTPEGAAISAVFDWRQKGEQSWDIHIQTAQGNAVLSRGGAVFSVDGVEIGRGANKEYRQLYARFADLVMQKKIDVDLSPMTHVSDAFTLGKRVVVDPFNW